jgi:microcystin-dependent protein
MSERFLGEIRLMSFNFAPKGWALCNGPFLPISQNQALFSLLGTTYGGNGTTTFQLPNLQGRVPMHFGNGHTQGQSSGEPNHTLLTSELPTHTHLAQGSPTAANQPVPTGAVLGQANNLYHAATNQVALGPSSVATAGASQPHENRQPFLTLTFAIALQGIFPSRN